MWSLVKSVIACVCCAMTSGVSFGQAVASVSEGLTTSGLTSFTFTLNPGSLTGSYNLAELTVTADPGTVFNQTGDDFVVLGEDDSGFNGELVTPGFLGGENLTAIIQEDRFDTPTELFAPFTELGEVNGVSNRGTLSFAQAVLPSGEGGSGSFEFVLFDANGSIVSMVGGVFGGIVVAIPGDFDDDGDVDGADFGVFVGEFQTGDTGGPGAAAPFSQADLNMSGFVDGADFGIFVDSFQNFPPMSAVAVPEPSVISLVALAIAGAACGRRGC